MRCIYNGRQWNGLLLKGRKTIIGQRQKSKWAAPTLVLGGEEGQPGTRLCCPLQTSQYNPKIYNKTKQNCLLYLQVVGFKIL